MQLSRYIDHTLLKAEATSDQINTLCKEALQFEFFSVCVNSRFVARCANLLRSSNVKVCAVVGFPLGAMGTTAKAYETSEAIREGADEIDMVLPVGALKDKDYEYVLNDIRAVVLAANGKSVKVILETSMLNEFEKVKACELALEAQAKFVKTSTGFGGGGATVPDIQLMKKTVGNQAEVKASGGIKTRQQAEDLIAAGATRLGTSSGVLLVQNQAAMGDY